MSSLERVSGNRPRRIAIDARMRRHSGIGAYVQGLLGALPKLDPPVDVIALGPETGLTAPIYGIREQFAVPRAFRRVDPPADLLHVPHFNAPLRFGGTLVVTIHDLIPLKLPKLTRRIGAGTFARFVIPRVCRRAAAVICVSDWTRRDLLELVPDVEARVSVIPNGCEILAPAADRRDAVLARYGLAPGYLLYVGNVRPHKNLDLALRARNRVPEARRRLFVLAGDDQMPARWEGRTAGGVRLLGRVPDDDLPALYSGAAVFVFPSLYEGFGLPPLEAMACGTPVACSNASSLPEVVGDAALLFSPTDEAACAAAIERILGDESCGDDLRARGRARAAAFTWQRTARATAEVYDRAAATSSSTARILRA